MAITQHGLGRGLDALFGTGHASEPDASITSEVKTLPIAALRPAANQPRKHFDKTALEELAASIQSQGLIQPVLVRPIGDSVPAEYEIVAGERRWRAAKLAGLLEIPVFIREMTDGDALTAALIENVQRENLNPIEEASALAGIRERLAISQDDLASRLGKSRSAVANALRLLQLSEPMQQALRDGQISSGHARALLAVSDEARDRSLLFQAVCSRHMTVRETEEAASFWKENGMLPAWNESRSAKKKSSRSPKPESIRTAVRILRQNLHLKVSISGTETAGRITLPYESGKELSEILERFGLELGNLSKDSKIS